MSLQDEVKTARKEIVSDGYEMSLGEIINLYQNSELVINPAFQRLFRWDETRKTRFIESLLLGIPIPPIFVYQDEAGVWELIDGLQRLSTVFQFAGILKGDRAAELGTLVLQGTNALPSLDGKRWEKSADEADDGIGQALQLQIKRTRIRVEILKQESDPTAKFELFQRLNTGGASLSEQEIRSSVAVLLNNEFAEWLTQLARNQSFKNTTDQTTVAIEAQADVELALRLMAFREVPYQKRLDIHEYLDSALIEIANNKTFDLETFQRDFEDTFQFLDQALGDSAFKRWDGNSFRGKFLISVYEVIAYGVLRNIDTLKGMQEEDRKTFLIGRAKELWTDPTFRANSGGGVRGTTRLANLLPMAEDFLRPQNT